MARVFLSDPTGLPVVVCTGVEVSQQSIAVVVVEAEHAILQHPGLSSKPWGRGRFVWRVSALVLELQLGVGLIINV